MNLKDARGLLAFRKISNDLPQTWADLGCGGGLFTNALADILNYGSKIYAVDKNINVFRANPNQGVTIEKVKGDFVADNLNISDLDGILMANSFHFVARKVEFLDKLRQYFKRNETYLIVEYDTDDSNPWVPYPMSFHSMRRFFLSLGFDVDKIDELPSRYSHGSIYSAFIQRSRI